MRFGQDHFREHIVQEITVRALAPAAVLPERHSQSGREPLNDRQRFRYDTLAVSQRTREEYRAQIALRLGVVVPRRPCWNVPAGLAVVRIVTGRIDQHCAVAQPPVDLECGRGSAHVTVRPAIELDLQVRLQ